VSLLVYSSITHCRHVLYSTSYIFLSCNLQSHIFRSRIFSALVPEIYRGGSKIQTYVTWPKPHPGLIHWRTIDWLRLNRCQSTDLSTRDRPASRLTCKSTSDKICAFLPRCCCAAIVVSSANPKLWSHLDDEQIRLTGHIKNSAKNTLMQLNKMHQVDNQSIKL